MNIVATEPIFSREGDSWQPHVEASGPFRGLHGGAVSGLSVGVMEEKARAEDWGIPLTASVFILRPAPLEPLRAHVEPLRIGGRIAIVESHILAGDKLIAKATAAFVKAIEVPELARVAAAPAPVDPSTLPAWQRTRGAPQRTTFFDALDIRDDSKGTKWGRMKRPMLPFAAPLANLFAFADNGTPYWLSGTEFWPPSWGFPNIDITVHVARAPEGSWVGVTPQSDWRTDGMGLTDSRLFDAQGPLGHANQTVVITPIS